MPIRIVNILAHLAVAAMMLVPTGMCICADADDESPCEQHEPGCPKVRKLDTPGGSQCYAGDPTNTGVIAVTDDDRPPGPSRLVKAVGHGPPRGSPIYITLGTLLI